MLLFLAYKFRLPPANFILLGFFLCAFQISGYGQLDTKHFIPPMHARTLAGNHFLVLGTPVSTSFDVLVTDGAGNIIATLPVSNAASTTISLGSDYNLNLFMQALESSFIIRQVHLLQKVRVRL